MLRQTTTIILMFINTLIYFYLLTLIGRALAL